MKDCCKKAYANGKEAGKAEVKGGCSCGNDVVYLSYCMECLHDLEVEAEQRGAQAERDRHLQGKCGPCVCYQKGCADTSEKWKKAICATDTIDAPEGGVIGVKAYWVDLEKLKEQGVEI